MHNHNFWGSHFRRVFIPHLQRLLDVLETRFLPTLGNLEAEATEVQDRVFREINESPGDEYSDPSMPAEVAFEEGLSYYTGMSAVRQAVLNAFAPILYHAWEQQLLTFHRREILHPREEHDKKFMTRALLAERLKAYGIELEDLPSWATVEELRVVANAVKHADGSSADALRELPNYFEHPDAGNVGLSGFKYRPRVYLPLSGDDIYVRLEDLRRFGVALVDFWSEFESALATGQELRW
jgi:hypothetical protein